MSTKIQKIKKRNGQVVEFSPDKIEKAMDSAFMGIQGGIDQGRVHEMADHVIRELENKFHEDAPSVEDVQDLVERELMKNKFFDVAKSYILYRYDHTKVRQEKELDNLEKLEKKRFFSSEAVREKKKILF